MDLRRCNNHMVTIVRRQIASPILPVKVYKTISSLTRRVKTMNLNKLMKNRYIFQKYKFVGQTISQTLKKSLIFPQFHKVKRQLRKKERNLSTIRLTIRHIRQIICIKILKVT